MGTTTHRTLICCCALLTAFHANAQNSGDDSDGHKTEPQIVRLSLIEGDVRVLRGKSAEKTQNGAWEQAQLNLPIQAGYSLATGNGQAEIEFEDASTVYLGQNSILTFSKLTSSDDRTRTILDLVSGTLTLNVHLNQGDKFDLVTPADAMHVNYPTSGLTRINSFLDVTGITPLRDGNLDMGKQGVATAGQMTLVREGEVLPGRPALRNVSFSGWDEWVRNRVVSRDVAMTNAMRASGLDEPLPGLADMASQGHFFDCAPYGRCWEPSATPPKPSQVDASPAQSPTVSVADLAYAAAHPQYQAASQAPGTYPYSSPYSYPYPDADFYGFPCSRELLSYDQAYFVNTGFLGFGSPDFLWDTYPYPWAVCRAGSWIQRNNRYVWVVGKRRHHHPPVRWVRLDGKIAYVPLHPHDLKDKDPINVKHGLYELGPKEAPVRRVEYNSAMSLRLLSDAPKEYEKPVEVPLPASQPPQIQAHYLSDLTTIRGMRGGSAAYAVRTAGQPITFDQRSHTFVAAHQEMQGNRSVTVAQPLGGGASAMRSGGTPSGGYSGGERFSGGSGAARSAGPSYSGGSSAGASHAASAPAAAPAASGTKGH